jgi:hypothetical protein
MEANKDITIKKYSINSALLTILHNKLASSDKDSDVLLFGSQNDIQVKKTDDR